MKEFYHQLIPNSQYFNNINQIIELVKFSTLTEIEKKYFLIALENTKTNGYEIKKSECSCIECNCIECHCKTKK